MVDERVTELRPKLEFLDDESRESLATFLSRGESMKAELLRFAHINAGADLGDDPDADVWHGDLGEMKQWIRQANTLKTAARRQRDANLKAMGQAAIDAGMTGEEYAKAVVGKSARRLEAWAAERGLSEQEMAEEFEKLSPAERQEIIGPPTL